MELYEKLTGKFSAAHFSMSITQTEIREDEAQATTRNITFMHSGTEVLRIDKTLFVTVRDTVLSSTTKTMPTEVCDGAIATEKPTQFIGYVELKSACTPNNVRKARSQIIASRTLMQTACISCAYPIDGYIQKGIIITRPITDQDYINAVKRRRRDDDLQKVYSQSRFLLNLIEGKAKDNETGMPFLYFTAKEIPISNLITF